ncbi:BamA/TamA family outer membrane protein [Chitinophaga sp. 22321]|uniref:BamA/TamA family outer membrane protein n=1 Tax=Chitinophaga hostae TaxID=2831022 RepID=A0ABS5J3C3_9BACT|nr:BamA/TamA family outer membrane protein [Chitinophaga hostae]MBS0029731.1 BamA/TamA family outer membrane protein [Chitinophaga hostae]
MRKNLHITALLILLAAGARAQQDSVTNNTPSREGLYDSLWLRKRSFFPLPVLGYSQEKGLEIGAAMLYAFYTDNKNPDRSTRNSTINLIPAVTTEKQFKIDLKTNIWTRSNTWHFKSNLRYHNYPLYFFGIGDTTHYDNRSLVKNTRYKVQVEGERRVSGHFYAGASVLYQHDTYGSGDSKGIYTTVPLVDKEGGYVTFLGLTGIFDNRDNENFTRRGWWLKLNAAYAPAFLSKHPLFKLEAQGTHFIAFSRKSTLGFHGIFNSLQGDNLPFYLLPEMGNDQIMRGYYAGRYRNQNYLAGQAEYRYLVDPKMRIHIWFVDIKPKFALAAFAGTGTVFSNHDFRFGGFKPSYGAGIRYFYDENARLTIRIDYAVGEKRSGESRQKGLYLSLAEAF